MRSANSSRSRLYLLDHLMSPPTRRIKSSTSLEIAQFQLSKFTAPYYSHFNGSKYFSYHQIHWSFSQARASSKHTPHQLNESFDHAFVSFQPSLATEDRANFSRHGVS